MSLDQPKVSEQTADATVPLLVEERQLLRILQPGLRQKIEASVRSAPALTQYVIKHEGEIYLSLESIQDSQQRSQTYDLIQHYQIDDKVPLKNIPEGLRACLQPDTHRHTRFIGAVALGTLVGFVFGLVGLAFCILILSIGGLADEMAGMTITAVAFVTCLALGWIATTYYLWRVRPLPLWQG